MGTTNYGKSFRVYACAYYSEVTGSKTLLVVERPDGIKFRILIDDGYFQEIPYRFLNYVEEFDPAEIDAIIITHNHIDHTGMVPRTVKQGFRKNIYMTEITQMLIGDYWRDSAEQQEDNARDMRERYPDEAHKFHALYHIEDVEKSMKHCVGLGYRKTIEILPGVKLTFWENAHLLGASMVLLQCSYPGLKPFNFLFTGDFKFESSFSKVPLFPKWFRNMELIMFCESTYGSTRREDIKYCFRDNILEAFARKQNILIGAFAQGRMQEMLYEFKCMQDEGLIPPEYEIWVDGPLGITTTYKYQAILEAYGNPRKDFLPKGWQIVNPKTRESILSNGVPKILITTSGMLSNGPAKVYVPLFLEHPHSLIHLVGYAAEETLARKLLDTKREETVTIGNKLYQKRAVVKTTREKTSHATEDELLELINLFTNVRFLGIVHGNTDVKAVFEQDIKKECPNVQDVGIFDREHMFAFYREGLKDDPYTRINVKAMPAGLLTDSKLLFGKAASEEKISENRRRAKEAKTNKSAKPKKGKRKCQNKGYKQKNNKKHRRNAPRDRGRRN